MKYLNRPFRAILCGSFSLCVAINATAQGGQQVPQKKQQEQVIVSVPGKTPNFKDRINLNAPVPANAIRVNVRYRKEYGYKGSANAFGDAGPPSCDAFSVNVSAPGNNLRPTNLIPINSDFKMESVAGYYVCTYLISDLPLNERIEVSATISGSPTTESWKGGSNAHPPAGQPRRIIDNQRTVILTRAQPRATQVFEMVYAPLPLKPLIQPVPQRRRSPAPSPPAQPYPSSEE